MEHPEKEKLRALLEDCLRSCLISFSSIEFEVEEGGIIRFNVQTDEPALLIGKHAENLFAFQHIFRLMARKQFGLAEHMVVDVDNYRRSQESSAVQIAETAAKRAKDQGLPQELMPMPSYKRRAIHTLFTRPEYSGFRVYSVGEGEERRVRVEYHQA